MQFKTEILQLVALRQRKGISLESIAEQTKICAYYLRAIEGLDPEKLPTGLYRDNFLSQYAQIIDDDLARELTCKLAVAGRGVSNPKANPISRVSLLRVLRDLLVKGVAILGLFAQGGPGFSQQPPQSHTASGDKRTQALRKFFTKCSCPIVRHTDEFIDAADRYRLDWRLLPSIAFLESSGGKHQKGRNSFGWASGRRRFSTTRQAIYYVAERLAISPLYAGKDLREKLRIYNPANKEYAKRVLEVMDSVSPIRVSVKP